MRVRVCVGVIGWMCFAREGKLFGLARWVLQICSMDWSFEREMFGLHKVLEIISMGFSFEREMFGLHQVFMIISMDSSR